MELQGLGIITEAEFATIKAKFMQESFGVAN